VTRVDRYMPAMCRAAGIEHATPHDLRRSCATHLAEIGVLPHIIESILNHASGGHKKGTAGVYNRAPYERESASALARWADHVVGLVEGRQAGGNIIPMVR
jgi:integrase